ncbi:MAG: hypothetical protein N2515_07635, partial [Deltaproteobacteria bacterium]|nr:hypothetical protein [Deltaproteobacteria bacterium]
MMPSKKKELLSACLPIALMVSACESPPPKESDAFTPPRPDAFQEADALREDSAPTSDAPPPLADSGQDGAVTDAHMPRICMPEASDYPGSSDYACPSVRTASMWPRIGASIGTIARMEQYEQIAGRLFDPGRDPTPDDFDQARTTYAVSEGLGSRVSRRFDLHYPIPPPPGGSVRFCQDESIWRSHPHFCVGPATLNPIILDMFQRGATGDPSESPRAYAARIEAALVWFVYTSVYKEITTCAYLFPGMDGKREDCDSAWAYYTGGRERSAMPSEEIAFARVVRSISSLAHERILDGIWAARCWRDMEDRSLMEMGRPLMPLPSHTMPEALIHRSLFERARSQTDRALLYALSQILIHRLERLRSTSGAEQSHHLAFLRTLLAPIPARTIRVDGTEVSYPAREDPLMDRPIRERNPASADFIRTEIQKAPEMIDTNGIISRLNEAFP